MVSTNYQCISLYILFLWHISVVIFHETTMTLVLMHKGARYSSYYCFPAFCFFNLLDQCRNNLVNVANDAILGNIENGSFRVLIYGNNSPRILNSNKMLDRTRNSASDI